MRKISRVVVREMTTLTNEEMALITGGNDGGGATTTDDKKDVTCDSTNYGTPCYYYDALNNRVEGKCQYYFYSGGNQTINISYCG